VALAERSADGLVEGSRLESAFLDACKAVDQTGPAQRAAARLAAAAAHPHLQWRGRPHALVAALDELAATDTGGGTFLDVFRALVADVVGPLDHPDLDPAWRTPTAVSLAQQVLQERDEVAMLVLADALEEAGCTDEELLAHCRGPGPHVRGCWALDAIFAAT
jgi:hypothetical protein